MKRIVPAASLYLIITLGIMYSWFHWGLMYGGGDVGLPTYNPQRMLQIVSQPWWTETAPGFPRPQNLTALPAYIFFAFLQQIGLPAFMIQAVVFGILLFLMGFGMYLMAKSIMKNRGMAILAGLFYMVNPYMMVLVWHRFVYTTFFFAASLPVLLLLWRKWIREKSYASLFLFIIVNLIFSYMFATLAYVITLWTLLGIYILFEIFVPWNGWKKAIKIIAAFSLGFFLWILTNTWWILPVFFVLPTLVSAQHSVGDTLFTLFEIGKQSIIPYSLPGLNSFYLFQRQELGEVFKHPLFLFIPYLEVSFIVIGIYYTIKKRELIFWSILFISAVFLAKGVAAPLSYFYPYLFEKFFFLGILRNPFEKFGLLIPFAGSILFAIGFFNLATYFWKRNNLGGKAVIILSFCLFFGVYHWPFWTGTLLGTLEKRNFVEIPQYYQQANEWISSQKKEGNILHLPLASGESATYRWLHGYSGLDPNFNFFTSNPSILTGFNVSYLDNALHGFDLMIMLDQNRYSAYLKELFRAFNVRFIVLHNDINWQTSKVQSPEKIGNILDSLPFLKKQKVIGELAIYQIDDDSFLNKIYLASNFSELESGQNYIAWSWFLRNSQQPFLSDKLSDKELLNLPGKKEIVILPQASIKISDSKLISEENSLLELPAIRFLPDSPLYPLIIFKEFVQQNSFHPPEENIALDYAGKRLVEASRILDKNPDYSISEIMRRYITYLDKAITKILNDGIIKEEAPIWLRKTFARHQIVLEYINKRAKESDKEAVNQALMFLRQKLIESNMQKVYEQISEKELDQDNKIYKYSIPIDGEYEILMRDSKVASLYENNLGKLNLQIDDAVQSRDSKVEEDLISFGEVALRKGQHEISFQMQNSMNLVKDKQDQIEIVSGRHSPNTYDIKIEPFHPNSTYILSFEYWIKNGSEPIIRALQDSDPSDYLATDALMKQRDYQFMGQVETDTYNKYWKTYYLIASPRKNSNNFSFQVISIPWDNCKVFTAKKLLCDNPRLKFNFQRSSTIVIRNIKVQRVLDNILFLRSKDTVRIQPTTNLSYSKKAPLAYEGSLTIDKPSFMIFSETFSDGWELTLDKDGEEYKPSKHFFANIYANGWFLDKNGTYKFKIIFSPQKYFYLGIYISLFGLLIFTGVYFQRKELVHLISKYLK